MVKIAPSILSGNFLNLEPDIRMVNENADLIHIDVMDGSLVPNISFGFPVMEAIAKAVTVPMDVHLMIVNPDKYIERFARCGADMISFHLEAADRSGKDPKDIIALIKSCGAKAGLAINPDIPVERLFPYIEDVDFFLIMSVFAGFGGQKFIVESIDRIKALKAEMDRRGTVKDIEVDGGVSASNSGILADDDVGCGKLCLQSRESGQSYCRTSLDDITYLLKGELGTFAFFRFKTKHTTVGDTDDSGTYWHPCRADDIFIERSEPIESGGIFIGVVVAA